MRRPALPAAALALLAALPLPLAGCSTLMALQSKDRVELRAAQALYAAEAAFSGASTALEQATGSGLLKGAAAAKARKAFEDAHAALAAARAARTAADAGDESAKAGEALKRAAEVEQLATSGGGFGQSSF